jgi:thioredoxin 1
MEKVADQDFDTRVLKSSMPAAVLFKSLGCPFCTKMAPIMEGLAADYAGKMRILVMDVSEGTKTAIRYGVLGVPQVLFFKGGEKVADIAGWVPKADVVDKVEGVLR